MPSPDDTKKRSRIAELLTVAGAMLILLAAYIIYYVVT
jgi:hypothetical protein